MRKARQSTTTNSHIYAGPGAGREWWVSDDYYSAGVLSSTSASYFARAHSHRFVTLFTTAITYLLLGAVVVDEVAIVNSGRARVIMIRHAGTNL